MGFSSFPHILSLRRPIPRTQCLAHFCPGPLKPQTSLWWPPNATTGASFEGSTNVRRWDIVQPRWTWFCAPSYGDTFESRYLPSSHDIFRSKAVKLTREFIHVRAIVQTAAHFPSRTWRTLRMLRLRPYSPDE